MYIQFSVYSLNNLILNINRNQTYIDYKSIYSTTLRLRCINNYVHPDVSFMQIK